MAENQFTTGAGVSEGQAPPLEGNKFICEACGDMEEVRPGKKVCWPCELEQMRAEARTEAEDAAKQELIEEKTTSKWLALLFEEAFSGVKALCVILDDAEYDDTLAVLAPLVKHLETDLRRIAEIISSTLGEIDVLVCTDRLIVDGREYREGDLYQATLTPEEAKGGAGQLQ